MSNRKTHNDKHSLTIRGHRTSVTLEPAFWESLKEIAAARGETVNTLVAQIDTDSPVNLSSAIRLFVLGYYKQKADEKIILTD